MRLMRFKYFFFFVAIFLLTPNIYLWELKKYVKNVNEETIASIIKISFTP